MKGTLTWMVDFAHGKPFLNIHTDHHDGQVGVAKGTSTAFEQQPANVVGISAKISPKDLFPKRDLDLIAMVDTAGFAKEGINPDQVMNAAFGYEKGIDVSKNHTMMGLVVNKLLLANKNKPGFLADIVQKSSPSLVNMYVNIVKIAKKHGWKTSDVVSTTMDTYIDQQRGNMQADNVPPKNLKNGQSTQWGATIVQYGGGYMGKGRTYDRYTPFKLHPDADFMVIGWPMGLVQASKNPFKSGKNPDHLGDLAKRVLNSKWKSKLQKKMVSLADLKRIMEMDIKPADRDAMGFKWEDLVALFGTKEIKGVDLSGEGGWTKFLHSITDQKWMRLSPKQKAVMQKVSISLWDIIEAQSGGHKDITNISGLNFWGKGYVDAILKPFMADLAKEMEKLRLK